MINDKYCGLTQKVDALHGPSARPGPSLSPLTSVHGIRLRLVGSPSCAEATSAAVTPSAESSSCLSASAAAIDCLEHGAAQSEDLSRRAETGIRSGQLADNQGIAGRRPVRGKVAGKVGGQLSVGWLARPAGLYVLQSSHMSRPAPRPTAISPAAHRRLPLDCRSVRAGSAHASCAFRLTASPQAMRSRAARRV